MKIYFNKAFVETKRETEDLWVKGNNGNELQVYVEELDLTSANINARLLIEWSNGETTNELPMNKNYFNKCFYITMPILKESGEVKLQVNIYQNSTLNRTLIFTRQIKNSINASDETNITPEEYQSFINNLENINSNIALNSSKIENNERNISDNGRLLDDLNNKANINIQDIANLKTRVSANESKTDANATNIEEVDSRLMTTIEAVSSSLKGTQTHLSGLDEKVDSNIADFKKRITNLENDYDLVTMGTVTDPEDIALETAEPGTLYKVQNAFTTEGDRWLEGNGKEYPPLTRIAVVRDVVNNRNILTVIDAEVNVKGQLVDVEAKLNNIEKDVDEIKPKTDLIDDISDAAERHNNDILLLEGFEGISAIPSSNAYVDTIYFNKSLSKEKLYYFLDEISYPTSVVPEYGIKGNIVAVKSDGSETLLILEQGEDYAIATVDSNMQFKEAIYIPNELIASAYNISFIGWNPYLDTSYAWKSEILSGYGLENEKLKGVISTSEFKDNEINKLIKKNDYEIKIDDREFVENIYFNLSLTKEEVVEELNKLNCFDLGNGIIGYVIVDLIDPSKDICLVVKNGDNYQLATFIQLLNNQYFFDSNEGWVNGFTGIVRVNTVPKTTNEIKQEIPNYVYQNDKIVNLVSKNFNVGLNNLRISNEKASVSVDEKIEQAINGLLLTEV